MSQKDRCNALLADADGFQRQYKKHWLKLSHAVDAKDWNTASGYIGDCQEFVDK